MERYFVWLREDGFVRLSKENLTAENAEVFFATWRLSVQKLSRKGAKPQRLGAGSFPKHRSYPTKESLLELPEKIELTENEPVK